MSIRFAAELVFWSSVAALFYTYIGYPILIAVLGSLRPRKVRRREYLPKVTFIITAYNEERDLSAKLDNTLSLDYPADLLEVIVASDCSSDRTDDIVRAFASRGVQLQRQPQRLGKTAAQNAAVEKATGEVLLFSDATSIYRSNVLRVLMRNFADSTVGCVGGRLVYVDEKESQVGQGAKSYWGYETFLKRHESRACSLIGVSGCVYAVRRSAYLPLYNEACSDFVIATKMYEQGLRTVFEPEAICYEQTNDRQENELSMRVRVIAQTFADLWHHRSVLNPFYSGLYGVQLVSHKLMRYLMPIFLLLSFIASAMLWSGNRFYAVVFLLQSAACICAVASWLLTKIGVRNRMFALPQYFLLANVAAVLAMIQFLRGERYAHWEPIR